MTIKRGHPAFASFWSVYRQFDTEESRGEIVDFYLKLEQAADKAFKKETIKEGDSFIVPMEGFFALRFEFFKKGLAVHIKHPEQDEKCVVSKEDSAKNEYRFLYGMAETCKAYGSGIGAPHTKGFKDFLVEMKAGQIVSFEDGASYICLSKDGTNLVLQKTYDGDLNKIDIAKIQTEAPFVLDYSNTLSRQRFYAKNKKTYTDGTVSRTYPVYRAEEEINRLIGTLEKGRSKTVSIGPASLVMSRNKKGEVSWYDKTGARINENKIKYLIGFFESAPVKTEYIRKVPTAKKAVVDEAFAKNIEDKLNKGDYGFAYTDICRYVINNKQDLSVNMSSFVKNNAGEYVAVTYSFKEENGRCVVSELSYPGNDLSAPFDGVREISEAEFIRFCEEKYKKDCLILTNDILKRMDKIYGEKDGKNRNDQKRIVANRLAVAQNIAEKSPPRIMTKEEIAIMREEVDEVLENYLSLRDKENMSVDELLDAILPGGRDTQERD